MHLLVLCCCCGFAAMLHSCYKGEDIDFYSTTGCLIISMQFLCNHIICNHIFWSSDDIFFESRRFSNIILSWNLCWIWYESSKICHGTLTWILCKDSRKVWVLLFFFHFHKFGLPNEKFLAYVHEIDIIGFTNTKYYIYT